MQGLATIPHGSFTFADGAGRSFRQSRRVLNIPPTMNEEGAPLFADDDLGKANGIGGHNAALGVEGSGPSMLEVQTRVMSIIEVRILHSCASVDNPDLRLICSAESGCSSDHVPVCSFVIDSTGS